MSSPPWPDDHVDTLKKGVAAGLSASQIAGELWRVHHFAHSRNAVIGKVSRLGLSLKGQLGSAASMNSRVNGSRGYRQPKAPPVKKGPPNPVGNLPSTIRVGSNGVRAYQAPPTAPLPPERDEEPGSCTIFTLRDSSCRWMIGDTYCGKRKERGSYCGCHAKIAFRPKAVAQPDQNDRRRSAGRHP